MTTPCEHLPSIGPFEILDLIGRGGSATVYKARHKPTGYIVAIKVGPTLLDLEPAALERFRREFTAVRDVRHPSLVRALDCGEDNGIPYLVQQYVPGKNLEERVKAGGPLPPREAVRVFWQLTEGLQHLHAQQILHRDIKPSNVFLHQEGQAMLGDFGLLKRLCDEAPLTQSNQGMGTMEYGAPEQFENAKRVDCRCDLYSLAATFYTALTGKFPFGVGGQMINLQRKLLHQFVPLRLLLPAIDPELDRLVCASLEPNPALRPADCDEFIAVLKRSAARADGDPSVTGADAGAGAGPATGRERRTTLRFAVDLTAAFVPFHQNMRGRWQASILDVSTGGICLQTSRPVAINSVLQVTLGGRTTTELVLVRWVKPGDGESQIAGCSFVRPLSDEELNALRPADAPAPVEGQ